MGVATNLISFNRKKVYESSIDFSINYYIETNTDYGTGSAQTYEVGTEWKRTQNCNFEIVCSDGNFSSGSLQENSNDNYTFSDFLSINQLDFSNESDKLKIETVTLKMTWEWAEGTWKWGNQVTYIDEEIDSIDKIQKYDTGKKRLVITSEPEPIDWEQKKVYDWIQQDYDVNGDNVVDEKDVEWQWTGKYQKGDPTKWKISYFIEESIPGNVIWNNDGNASSTFSFYPATNGFSFNNCSPGAKWDISKGLTSLIDNLYLFTPYATQWKNWKYGNPDNSNELKSQGTCPQWIRGKLSASNLNDIHTYMGTGQSYSAGYKPENRVKAEMFTLLAEKIGS